jgi:thiol-disulfide isomerase/thioredoxin
VIGILLAATVVAIAFGVSRGGEAATTIPGPDDLAANEPGVPANSDRAPTFVLETLDGETFDLGRHFAEDGRPVFLNLWASWCPPCRSEMPAIQEASLRHPEVLFVGVAVQDKAADSSAFVSEIGATYTIAVDDGTVADAYPVLALPTSFYIDGDGVIVKRHFGLVTGDLIDSDLAALFGTG